MKTAAFEVSMSRSCVHLGDALPPSPPSRQRRSWYRKFHEATRGVKLGIRGHSSFFVHFFVAGLVIAVATALGCSLLRWCMLLGCIGLVLTAELFNSAVETLFHGLDHETRNRCWPALDIAAGAVLLASLFAAAIGSIIFIDRIVELLK
jgi:diacylglycerol kinase